MSIVHVDAQPFEKEFFQGALSGYSQVFVTQQELMQGLDIMTDCEVLDVFIHNPVTADMIAHLPKLTLIVTRSTGFDHIDMQAARARGITVCNVPVYGSETIAEHTFGLLLNLSHRIGELNERTREGNFHFLDKRGFDLEGKTFGIIGTGHIGKKVIGIAQAFGLKVLAFDLYPDTDAAAKMGYTYVSLEELLAQSDIISLHVPCNADTENLLPYDMLTIVKKGMVLLNTSRGNLLKNSDLVRLLDAGYIGYLGLDTMQGEEHMFAGNVDDDQKHLLQRENVVYTPHSAYYTKEATQRILETTKDNIAAFASGNEQNEVK